MLFGSSHENHGLKGILHVDKKKKCGEAGYVEKGPVPMSDRPSGGETNGRQWCHDSFSVLSDASSENLLVTLLQSVAPPVKFGNPPTSL